MSSNHSPTTTSTRREPVGAVRAAAMIIGPFLLLAGVVLMILPGFWTLSHLVFLAGSLAMLPTGVALHGLFVDRHPTWPTRTALLLTSAGALALAGQFVIDFVVVHVGGGDAEAVDRMFDTIQSAAPMDLIFYTVGPALLFTGLAVFGVLLILRPNPRRLPGWMLVAGASLMGVARVVESRPTEVVALAIIVVGLALAVRAGRGEPRPVATDRIGLTVAPKRRCRMVLLGALGAIVLVAAGLTLVTVLPAVSTTHDQIRLPIEQQLLRIDVSSGDVVLRHGTGTEIIVERTTRRGITEPTIRETSGDDGIVIEADCSGQFNSGCEVSYDITIPDGFDLEIEIGAGSLTARDIEVGTVNLRIASGDVELTGVSGLSEAVVDVASGEVSLDFASVPDSIDATVSSGRIEIGLPDGSYDVTAEAGAGDERIDVDVDPDSDSAIRARTGQGDIEIVGNGRR